MNFTRLKRVAGLLSHVVWWQHRRWDVLCSLSELLPTFCLETGVKSHQEGVGGGLLEDVLLSLHPVNILQGRGGMMTPSTINRLHTFLDNDSEDLSNQIKMPVQYKGRIHLQQTRPGAGEE